MLPKYCSSVLTIFFRISVGERHGDDQSAVAKNRKLDAPPVNMRLVGRGILDPVVSIENNLIQKLDSHCGSWIHFDVFRIV